MNNRVPRPAVGSRFCKKADPALHVEVRATSENHTVASSDDGAIQLARSHDDFLRDWEPETPHAAALRK